MQVIGVRELKTRATEILRSVREEGRSFEVTYRGRVIARLVPVSEPASPESVQEYWEAWDNLSRDISAHWPKGVSAVDAIREVRRDL